MEGAGMEGAGMEGAHVVRLRDVIDVVLRAYPAALAEDWDTGIGLTCGDPDAELTSVLLAVDADEVTVGEAIRQGADLLLTHHPLLFRPVQSVAADTAKGALIHRMIRAGVAHFAAHTNADSAVGGVNDALAQTLGVTDLRPLMPHAFGDGRTGSGRVGRLAAPVRLRDFVADVAHRLPATVTGVRAAGDPDRPVSIVALCGGAGDSLLTAAADAGADAYLTSDLRHHVVAEYVTDPDRPAVVEVAHWAGEWPWLPLAAAVIESELSGVHVTVSVTRTDPWTLRVPSTDG
jgi:dinuclear metal center YbgI/SA1388 family protein